MDDFASKLIYGNNYVDEKKLITEFIYERLHNSHVPRYWVAATFTLKQHDKRDDGTIQKLDRTEVEKCIHQFMKQLNRKVYGASSRRYGTRLSVVPVIEISKGGRLHVHLMLEVPRFLLDSRDEYFQLVTAEWKKLRWALPECHICYLEPGYNVYWWLQYILKDQTSQCESLDLFNLYLGQRQHRSVYDQGEEDKFLQTNKDALEKNHAGWCYFEAIEFTKYLDMLHAEHVAHPIASSRAWAVNN